MQVLLKELTLVAGLLTQSGADLPTEDVVCMARNVYHEARGEDIEGQLAVANVTMNRVAHPDFPDDVCGVVTEDRGPRVWDCQFSWWCDGRSDTPKDMMAYQEAILVSIEVMSGRAGDNTGAALYYVTGAALDRKWVQNLQPVGQIGRHHFMRPKGSQG